MTQDHTEGAPNDVDAGEAGFELLKARAQASGIPQDTPLDPSRFEAAMEQGAPAPITLSQLRDIATGVRAALALAQAAAAEFTRDEDASSIDPIVTQLQNVIDSLPAVPGLPL